MAQSTGARHFFKELASLIGATVVVSTNTGKTLTGKMRGYDPTTLSVVLADAHDKKGMLYHRIVITGHTILELVKTEDPFDLKGLAEQLETLFPPGEVRFLEDARVIVVLNKVRVTEQGVEGTGPLADRIRKVYTRFVEEQGEKTKDTTS
ncbi:MAG: Lsm family RNA-binding protein [Candidatus Hermodarchaeota archaeon]|nr:Lsm family RNA-binding protein [Candidatus Hermodarchaeota archaeon]